MFYTLGILLLILLPIVPWTIDLFFSGLKNRNLTKFLTIIHFYLLIMILVYLTYIQMKIVEIQNFLK